MNKIRVVIVEPDKEPYEARIKNTLKSMQRIVGGNLYFYEVEKNIDFIWNEEGKDLNLEFNRVIKDDVIAGTFIITGQQNGETTSLTQEQIVKYMKFFAVKNDEGVIAFLRQEVKRSSEAKKLNLLAIEKLRGTITK